MFSLDLKSKKSIHEQIVDGIKALIVNEELRADDKLPSVRDLSAQLTVNPNTIAKAFRTLESQGWIYTVSGRGCFVSEEKHTPNQEAADKAYGEISALIRELSFMGIDRNEIREKLLSMLEEGDEKND